MKTRAWQITAIAGAAPACARERVCRAAAPLRRSRRLHPQDADRPPAAEPRTASDGLSDLDAMTSAVPRRR